MFKCWKCSHNIEQSNKKISFRSTCEKCGSWQHACINCKHYKVGLPNHCSIPNTDPISDRENYNFCEDFCYLDKLEIQKNNPSTDSVSKKLFGSSDESEKKSGKDAFNSLFED